MSPKTSNGNAKGRWNCAWECGKCFGLDGFPQRNRADANKCRSCHKSYWAPGIFGKNVDDAKMPPARYAESDDAKKERQNFDQQKKELQAQITAFKKALAEGKPFPTADDVKAQLPDDKADNEAKEALDKAKKHLKDLHDLPAAAREIIGEELYTSKLNEAKLQVDNAAKAKFKGQPMDAQLRGSKARMEHTKQALEKHKVFQQKVHDAKAEATLKAEAADLTHAELVAKLDAQTMEYADLQNQNALLLVGKPTGATEAARGLETLQAVLQAIPEDYGNAICAQTGIPPDEFAATIEKIRRWSTMSISPSTSTPRSEPTPTPSIVTTAKLVEDEPEENEMDWDDLAANIENFELVDESDFKMDVENLVKVGFTAPEKGEEKEATTKRIIEFARKRKQEDLQRDEERKRSQAAFKIIKKSGKKAKGNASK